MHIPGVFGTSVNSQAVETRLQFIDSLADPRQWLREYFGLRASRTEKALVCRRVPDRSCVNSSKARGEREQGAFGAGRILFEQRFNQAAMLSQILEDEKAQVVTAPVEARTQRGRKRRAQELGAGRVAQKALRIARCAVGRVIRLGDNLLDDETCRRTAGQIVRSQQLVTAIVIRETRHVAKSHFSAQGLREHPLGRINCGDFYQRLTVSGYL